MVGAVATRFAGEKWKGVRPPSDPGATTALPADPRTRRAPHQQCRPGTTTTGQPIADAVLAQRCVLLWSSLELVELPPAARGRMDVSGPRTPMDWTAPGRRSGSSRGGAAEGEAGTPDGL